MSYTPRTDAVQTAAMALPHGSYVVVPKDHPPCDPWELARKLEVENNMLLEALEKIERHIEKAGCVDCKLCPFEALDAARAAIAKARGE